MKKRIIGRTVIGFFIGIAIGQIISVIITLCMGADEFVACTPMFAELIGSEANAAALQTLLCGVMGSGFAAASVVWELENLSIAAQSGICFGVYAAALLPIAYFTGWMEHSLAGILSYIGIFLATYAAVWISQYLSCRSKIKRINEKLNT